ncbi:ABC transporter permease subunit [Paenibacillus sp. TAF58]
MTIAGIAIWQSTGFIIVIYLAGLRSIPKELYDATSIDGASRFSQFNNVTFPLLAPSFTMGIVFMFTGMMREYDRIAVLTQGGPAGSTETMPMIPPQVILIPLVKVLTLLGLMFTSQGLILYYMGFYIPFTVFVYTGFIRTLSKELEGSTARTGRKCFRS